VIRCTDCGGLTVPNPRASLREPSSLCGNKECGFYDKYAERQLLMIAVCTAAHEWRHMSDDHTEGEDEAALGEAEEALAGAIDALTTRWRST
jgi:hypothetical protein